MHDSNYALNGLSEVTYAARLEFDIFKPDYVYWTKHYAGLLWRWKWYIIPVLPALVITWFLLVITFGTVRPELNVNVIFGFEKQSSVLVLPEAIPTGMGKMKLIQSRNFLSEIVDSLSLHFIIPKITDLHTEFCLC